MVIPQIEIDNFLLDKFIRKGINEQMGTYENNTSVKKHMGAGFGAAGEGFYKIDHFLSLQSIPAQIQIRQGESSGAAPLRTLSCSPNKTENYASYLM